MQDIKSSRQVGLFSLVAMGLSGVIGSGWLFSSYLTAKTVGGGAIFSWIVGALIMLVLGLMLAELGAMYPKVGLTSRLLTISHNKNFGYLPGFAIWFGTVASIPNEAQATVQYISTFRPAWTPYLFAHGDLTIGGIGLCVLLLLMFFFLNYWGIKLFAKFNNVLTTYKIVIPIATAIAIMLAAYHSSNFSGYHQTLLPYGVGSMFTAIVTCGIVFAFNGFQYIASFAAEVRNPSRNIPLALILTILACLAIYLLLQVAFIGGLSPNQVASGWSNLNFTSPIAQLTIALGLNVMSILLYVDACVSPSGAGLVYTSSTSRMLAAMADDNQIPACFKDRGNLLFRPASYFNLGLCIILLLFARNWQSLMIITSLYFIMSFMAYPLALGRLRKTEAATARPFKLPLAKLFCPIMFVILGLLFVQPGAHQVLLVSLVNVAFFLIYIAANNHFKWKEMVSSFFQGWHMVIYILSLAVLSLVIGDHSAAANLKHEEVFYGLTALSSIIFYYCTVRV